MSHLIRKDKDDGGVFDSHCNCFAYRKIQAGPNLVLADRSNSPCRPVHCGLRENDGRLREAPSKGRSKDGCRRVEGLEELGGRNGVVMGWDHGCPGEEDLKENSTAPDVLVCVRPSANVGFALGCFRARRPEAAGPLGPMTWITSAGWVVPQYTVVAVTLSDPLPIAFHPALFLWPPVTAGGAATACFSPAGCTPASCPSPPTQGTIYCGCALHRSAR